jgi:peptide/nickel transport system permease protein
MGWAAASRASRVAGRFGAFLLTLVIATFIAFALIKIVPGDPATAIAGENATPARLAEIRHQLGLDRSLLSQYGHWVGGAAHGDFGNSLYSGQRVMHLIGQRLPTTLELVLCAIAVALLIGVPAGIYGASRAGRPGDKAVTGLSTLGIAIPNFWLGLVAVTVFAIWHPWLPATGFVGPSEDFGEFLRHVALPAIALGAAGAAEVTRQLRGALLEVFASDYMRTAKAKGLPGRIVLFRHALRNAGVPFATVLGLLVNRLVGATVVVEAVFAIPGMGSLVIDAVHQRDYPVIQAVVFVMAFLVLVANFAVDIAYRRIDPRIRAS